MDTIGKSLVTSGFLVDQYFQSANRLVETRLGKPAMEPKDWKFNSHFLQYEELSGSHKSAFNYRYLNLYEQPNTDTRQGGYGHIEDFKQACPSPASTTSRSRPRRCIATRITTPPSSASTSPSPSSSASCLAMSPKATSITRRRLSRCSPAPSCRTTLPPGSNSACGSKRDKHRASSSRTARLNPAPPSSRSTSATKMSSKAMSAQSGVGRAHILKEGKLPHIRISEIKIHGPVPEKPGSAEEVAVFGKDGFQEAKCARSIECLRRESVSPTAHRCRSPAHPCAL
jgi:hypothetical protein